MGKIYDMTLNFKRKYGGIAWRIKKHSEVVEEYINPDEEILYAFCAQKNETFKEIFNTAAIVVTSKRILIGQKRLLWGSFYSAITPDLYNDLTIYKGLVWGKITIVLWPLV